MAEADMEVDNESDLDGNEVPSNDLDDDSDTDSGECDSEAGDDEDLRVEEDEDELEYY